VGKGLRSGTIGLTGSVVIAVSSVAPAYSLAAVLAGIVAVVGAKTPALFVIGFLPMLLTAFAFRELARQTPDCGSTFTWATRAFHRGGPARRSTPRRPRRWFCRPGSPGWWSWTISPDGVSWPCSNCVTIFTLFVSSSQLVTSSSTNWVTVSAPVRQLVYRERAERAHSRRRNKSQIRASSSAEESARKTARGSW
jgi:amino acid transporter